MLRTATQREPGHPPEQQTSSDLPSTRGACLAHPRASSPDSSLALRWHYVVWSQNDLLCYATVLGEEAPDQDCSLCNVAITRRSLLFFSTCSGEDALPLPAPMDQEPPGEG